MKLKLKLSIADHFESLDVAFREDECRIRKGHASENSALLRHLALSALN